MISNKELIIKNIDKIIKLNQKGLNEKEIAIKLGINPKTFNGWVNKLQIPILKGHKYFINEHFWDVIDTEEKAYLLGYLIADGCISNENKKHNGIVDSHTKRIAFCVSEDDKEVIKLYQHFIVPKKPIQHGNSQIGVKYKRKPQLIFRWHSSYMFDKLVSYGIKPRKTYDSEFKLPENLIPKNLMRHFIRGYFDGDGCKTQCGLQFCVNSKQFALQIANFFTPFKYRLEEKQGKTCTYYILNINGGKKLLQHVVQLFYQDSNYYLTRKYKKFNPELISSITKGELIMLPRVFDTRFWVKRYAELIGIFQYYKNHRIKSLWDNILIHSVSKPEILIPNEDEELQDVDVNAMYPSIIISNKLYPSHLKSEFVDVFNDIVVERLEAKRTGNTLKDSTLKFSINGLSGNLQSPFSWCYDPKMALTVRINGQLMLLMLAERLYNIGCRLINTNTDGEFILCKKSIVSEVEKCCKEWEKETGLTLATDRFERFYQYAINDYVGVKMGWSETHNPKLIKKKGLFIDTPTLGKGLAPLIIPEAINKYFVEGISPEETILNCKDIKKFCTFQKVAKDFNLEWGGTPVRHINRYYMSTNGKPLIKFKLENDVKIRPTLLCADSGVTLYNKFDDIPIEKRKINYQYYIKEVYKIINALEIKQLTLF